MSTDQNVPTQTPPEGQLNWTADTSPRPERTRDPWSPVIGIGAAIAGIWLGMTVPGSAAWLGALAVVAGLASLAFKGPAARRIQRAVISAVIAFALVPVLLMAYFVFAIGVMGARIG